MQALLGLLAFATRLLPMGRMAGRRLYMSIMGLKSLHSHIRITTDLKDDTLIWSKLLIHFKRRLLWQQEYIPDKDFCLSTEAVGSIGYAAGENIGTQVIGMPVGDKRVI